MYCTPAGRAASPTPGTPTRARAMSLLGREAQVVSMLYGNVANSRRGDGEETKVPAAAPLPNTGVYDIDRRNLPHRL